MALRVTCPNCTAVSILADQQAGTNVRCNNCEATLAVYTAAARPPARDVLPNPAPLLEQARTRSTRPTVSRSQAGNAPLHPKSGRLLLLLLILGGSAFALLLLLGCGGAAAYFFLNRSSSPAETAVAASAPKNEKDSPPNKLVQEPKKESEEDPRRPPRDNPPPVDPPRDDPRPVDPPQDNPRPVDPPVEGWQVQPDPVPAALMPPDNPQGPIPITGFFNAVVFPTTPSPFVGISAKTNAGEMREVYDLRNGQRVGIVSGQTFNAGIVSPDGQYVAYMGNPVDVYTVANGQGVKVTIGNAGFGPEFDFAGTGRLLVLKAEGFEQIVQVWDIQTSAVVCQFKPAAAKDRKQRALSAGHRYLALYKKSNDGVLIYDLGTGQLAGELSAPAGSTCQGLSFSRDGRSLVGLLTIAQGARLVVWNLTTGRQSFTHDFDKNPQTATPNASNYPGPAIDWLPSGSGWLLYGQLFVDERSGAVYGRLPLDKGDNGPRRLFGAGKWAHIKAQALVIDDLPADRLALGLQEARTGQDPKATLVPAARPADWSSVKQVAAGFAVPWTAGVDPAPQSRGPLGSRPLPLRGKADDLLRIVFSSPDVGVAAVLSGVPTDELSERRKVRVDRQDLMGGKDLGGLELFNADFPKGQPAQLEADLSPDGALLAVREPKAGKRIDVWSLTENKHLVGWLPCDKEADGQIRWLAFVDARRLLTLSSGQTLTLWEVPECRAVYSAGLVRSTPALSGPFHNER
jgi:hypothetical protein